MGAMKGSSSCLRFLILVDEPPSLCLRKIREIYANCAVIQDDNPSGI
jgi:hypothetical protein